MGNARISAGAFYIYGKEGSSQQRGALGLVGSGSDDERYGANNDD